MISWRCEIKNNEICQIKSAMWSLESKFDFNAEDDFLCGKLWQQTECALISSFGLTIKDGLFWLLLVGLDWKPGEHPVVKSTYSGISLVSWLEWEGKTVKDIHMRQDMCGQRQERSGWRTGLLERRKTANTRTHTRRQVNDRVLQPVVCELCVSVRARRSADCGPAFTLWSVCVKSCETKI